jgi:hypothetical protein
MVDIIKADEEINSIIGETSEPLEGAIRWWPNEDTGYEFVYKTDHWEVKPQDAI